MGDGQASAEPVGATQVTSVPALARTGIFWRRLAAAALIPLTIAATWEQWQLFNTLLARPWANAIDYRVYRVAATIGFHDGWSRVYDGTLQRALIVPLWPRAGWPAWWTSGQPFWTPFVSPPPVAWLAAPFNALPVGAAADVWLGIIGAGLALSVLLIVPSLRAAPLYIALPLLTWATALSIVTGNVAPLVGLGVVVCWWQVEREHFILAGLALALASMKPQVMFAVPLLLLVSGRKQVFRSWLVGVVVLAALSVATLQQEGVTDLLNLLRLVATYPHERELSVLGLPGSAAIDILLAVVTAALAVAATWSRRGSAGAVPVAVGLVASLLLSPYLNVEDFVLLIPAGLLLLRARLGLLIDVLAVALVLSATPASQGYVIPEIAIGLLVLAALASPWRPSRAPAAAARGAAPGQRTPSRAG